MLDAINGIIDSIKLYSAPQAERGWDSIYRNNYFIPDSLVPVFQNTIDTIAAFAQTNNYKKTADYAENLKLNQFTKGRSYGPDQNIVKIVTLREIITQDLLAELTQR